ncbi:MAG: chemotaxis protein CheA, partial [Gammaproteobacteria bacterium]|nr:chemotaxis protein CheA [Gammaproteobacteria bacterium]
MSINLEQFHQTFFEESFEGLDSMESGLLNLQAGTPDADTINTIFRAAHSIKGGSGTFGFGDVAKFTHVLETLLNEMRDGRRSATPEAVNLLLESVDCLREMLTAVRGKAAVNTARVADVQGRLEFMLSNGQPSAASQPPAVRAGTSNTDTVTATSGPRGWNIRFRPQSHLLKTGNDPLRIFRELDGMGSLKVEADLSTLPAFDQMDPESCYLAWSATLAGDAVETAVNELFDWVRDESEISISPVSTAAGSRPAPVAPAPDLRPAVVEAQATSTADVRTATRTPPASTEGTSIRVDIGKVDELINMVGELVITQNILRQVGENFDMSKLHRLTQALSELDRNTRELQESVMRIRMLPISFAFNRVPRLVHDLSTKLGKKVDLKMTGESTELDKTVMERIVDPLVHLVRNTCDHGIEMPEVRRAAGKPETGTLTLSAYHKGGSVVIEIADDGAGLNKEKILRKAIERGLVKPDATMTDDDIYGLIFLPGFSTADVVSDVSGRGVGMDVVRKNIQALGGGVEIASEPGKGAKFTVRLPLTLAIMDGQSVAVGKEFYIVPLVSIIVSTIVKNDHVSTMANGAEVFRFRDEYLPLIRLYELYSATPRTTNIQEGLMVVVEGDGKRA